MKKRKVLLVEDDPDVSEAIIAVLQSFMPDVEIEHIQEGGMFRQGTWKAGGWDLVVLDLMIPSMTGFEVCEQIRANPPTATVPILALTGYDTLQNEERIKASGASGYLPKPFEIKRLRGEIERLLSSG